MDERGRIEKLAQLRGVKPAREIDKLKHDKWLDGEPGEASEESDDGQEN